MRARAPRPSRTCAHVPRVRPVICLARPCARLRGSAAATHAQSGGCATAARSTRRSAAPSSAWRGGRRRRTRTCARRSCEHPARLGPARLRVDLAATARCSNSMQYSQPLIGSGSAEERDGREISVVLAFDCTRIGVEGTARSMRTCTTMRSMTSRRRCARAVHSTCGCGSYSYGRYPWHSYEH